MSEPLYWLVSPLSLEDTIRLQASDLIENYQRDVKTQAVRFWPASQGVFKYLTDNAPAGASVTKNDEEATKIKMPPVIHKSTGMSIDD